MTMLQSTSDGISIYIIEDSSINNGGINHQANERKNNEINELMNESGSKGFYPSGYCRPLCAPPHAATFGYYANVVQHIEFKIYTNIKPLQQT